MSRRDELLRRLQAVRDSLLAATSLLADIRSDIVDVVDRESVSGHYGIADAYQSAARDSEDVADRLVTADDGLNAMIGLITATETARKPGASTSLPRAAIDFAEPGEPTVYDPTFRYRRHIEAIRRFGWPKNKYGRVMARGLMYDINGDRILHNPLKARRRNEPYHAPELREPWRSDPEMTTSWHIEGGVAAYMRHTKTREMVLWLNLPPCGGPGSRDPKRCWGNLKAILPPGYTLHVHWENEDGSYENRRFNGTGEALK